MPDYAFFCPFSCIVTWQPCLAWAPQCLKHSHSIKAKKNTFKQQPQTCFRRILLSSVKQAPWGPPFFQLEQGIKPGLPLPYFIFFPLNFSSSNNTTCWEFATFFSFLQPPSFNFIPTHSCSFFPKKKNSARPNFSSPQFLPKWPNN